MKSPVNIFWFRRDLRLEDNVGLYQALQSGKPVLPIFIFDTAILDKLERNDSRVSFIHQNLEQLNFKLAEKGSRLLVLKGNPEIIWKNLIKEYNIETVFINHDYEPYALQHDQQISNLLVKNNIQLKSYKDQVIFEKNEVVKNDGKPYTVYTPYMRKWMARFETKHIKIYDSEKFLQNFVKLPPQNILSLEKIGFKKSEIAVPEYSIEPNLIEAFEQTRNFPALDTTSMIGPYLRFGLIGIRKLVLQVKNYYPTYLKELIWREFFMQILYHFPKVVDQSFKPRYDYIQWINDEKQFQAWCKGKTGYPMVDAGMRQLNKTGFMHNRVRMVTASFLCKHLLIDWRWGEAYFARKLLDYELSSNNGNWQWAAGSGCDAAPYFRVFNPAEQQKKFDKDLKYIKKWIPEFGTPDYPEPIVEHKFARERAISTYKNGLS